MSLEEQVADQADEQVANSAPDTEAEGAPEPSLDELLNQYDEQTTQAEPKKEPDNENAQILEFVKMQMQERTEAQVKTDIEESVKIAKEAGDLDLSDDLIEHYLRSKIQSDGRFLNLWQNRGTNRAAFDAVVKSLGKELSQPKGKVDEGVTADVDALASAVSGSSQTTVTDKEPDFLNMSQQDMEKWENKNLNK